MEQRGHILRMVDISKAFPGVQALDRVDFDLRKGEIHAIVGENGAGKSTLIKILSGLYKKDEGKIYLDGERIDIEGTHHAIELGISTIYQEIALVEDLSVAENIYLSVKPKTKLGTINWKEMQRQAGEILSTFSTEHIDPKEEVRNLSIAQKYFVEIAKALIHGSKIMIMDEATASLSETEIDMLYGTLRKLKAQGMAIIYISHRLDEIFNIADRVTVLRDGKVIRTMNVSETDSNHLINYMIGREITDLYGRTARCTEEVILRVENLSCEKKFANVSFDLHRGEILGLAGLVGAGRTDIVRALYGLERTSGGNIFIDGRRVRIRKPSDAVRYGIAYISEDRRSEGLVTSMAVKENITPLILNEISKLGVIQKRIETKITRKSVQDFSIKTPSINQLVINLSGGNQQKVVIAKGLTIAPKILILDEPTKGIDVGAKAEIHKLIKKLAQSGIGILLVSSEMPEILGMCQRIICVREGRIVGEFDISEATEEKLLKAAAGY